MSTFGTLMQKGHVHFGTGGDDTIILRGGYHDGNKIEVIVGGGGNDTLRASGKAHAAIFGGDGDDHLAQAPAFSPVKSANTHVAGKEGALYGGAGHDVIDIAGGYYANGDGAGNGLSDTEKMYPDDFIFHQEGPKNYHAEARLSSFDLGLDRAHLVSDDFEVVNITGHSVHNGADFQLAFVTVKGTPVEHGGGGEWIKLNFDPRTPAIIENGTHQEKLDYAHDLLHHDVFNF